MAKITKLAPEPYKQRRRRKGKKRKLTKEQKAEISARFKQPLPAQVNCVHCGERAFYEADTHGGVGKQLLCIQHAKHLPEIRKTRLLRSELKARIDWSKVKK